MTRVGLAVAVLAATFARSAANGRPPDTSTITFQRGDDTKIALGTTFGLVTTTDGGLTWSYTCEDAIGYGGSYDPDFVYAADGTVFATTFEGLRANHDGCVFEPTTLGTSFMSHVAQGPNGELYAAAVEPTDGKIYVSFDSGMTFPRSATPPGAQLNDVWRSIEVSPTDGERVYLSGVRVTPNQPRLQLLYRSEDGGQSFVPLTTMGMTLMSNSAIDIVQVSPANADVVYAHVLAEDNQTGEAIYKSVDKGETWTRLFGRAAKLSLIERKNGEVMVATQHVDEANGFGAFVSTDGGSSFIPLPGSPHIGCLVENGAGELWACTQNYGIPGVPTDGYGVMKLSADRTSWTGVLRYQSIGAPRSCTAGTVQHDRCDVQLWCGFCSQLGCDPNRACGSDAPLEDKPHGCCGAGRDEASLALSALVLAMIGRRRRSLRTR